MVESTAVPTTAIPTGPGVVTDQLLKMLIEEQRVEMAILIEIRTNTAGS